MVPIAREDFEKWNRWRELWWSTRNWLKGLLKTLGGKL